MQRRCASYLSCLDKAGRQMECMHAARLHSGRMHVPNSISCLLIEHRAIGWEIIIFAAFHSLFNGWNDHLFLLGADEETGREERRREGEPRQRQQPSSATLAAVQAEVAAAAASGQDRCDRWDSVPRCA